MSKLDEKDIEKYGYTLAAGIVGPEAAKVFHDSFLSPSKIPSVEKLLYEGDLGKLETIDDYSSLIVRIIDYLSNLSDLKLIQLEKNAATVAENLSKLARTMPKESFYALMRFIVDSSEKGGLTGKVMDKLLSKLMEYDEITEMVKEL